MNKRILACVTVIIMISVLFSGCVSSEASTKISDIFEYVGHSSEANCKIVCDTETKVMYAVLGDKAMTLLVDENGKPKLWKGMLKKCK